MQSRFVGAALAALLMTWPAIAQDVSPFITAQASDQHLAKDTLIGAKVYGKDGTIIGDIEDLILSDGNTVVGVIIGTGGFLGLAEKRIGIDLKALSSVEKDGKTVISLPIGHEDLVATSAYQRALPKKSLLERVKEKAQELSDKTTETTKDAYEKAKPTIDEAKEKAKEVYEDAKEKVQEAVGGESKPADTPTPDAAPPADESTPEAAAPAPEPTPEPPAKVETIPNQKPSWDEREAGQSLKLQTTEPPADAPAAAPEAAPAAETPADAAPAPEEATPAPAEPSPVPSPEAAPAPTPDQTEPATPAPETAPGTEATPDQAPATETPSEPPAQP